MKLFNRSQKFEVSKRKFDRLEAKTLNEPHTEHRSSPIFWLKKEKTISCQILLLDGSDLKFTLDKKALGEELLERVYVYLDLIERDYFGLQFMDHLQVAHWLDPTKSIKKQVKIGPPYSFSFRVKFYSSEPNNLREELTRYHFFLQLKRDILTGKIPCPYETAVELSAYALQSELGDYNPEEHTPSYISEFRFVPDQTEKMELDIIECYKEKKNQTPAQAEINYLTKVKWLDLYGIDFHTVLGKDGFEYSLGLTPTGVLVFERKQKIGLFLWPKINRFDFKNKKVILVVEEDEYITADEQGENYHVNDQASSTSPPPILIKKEHTFVFRTYNYKAAKHLWKCAVQYHAFFRLIANVPTSASNTANGHVSATSKRSGNNFFRMGSRFRYSGKTEFQATFDSKVRKSMQIERKPSQRYSRRPPNPHFLQQQSQRLQILTNINTNNNNKNDDPLNVNVDDILNHKPVTAPNLDMPDFFANLNINNTQPKLLSLSPIKEFEPAKSIKSSVKSKISPDNTLMSTGLNNNKNGNDICNESNEALLLGTTLKHKDITEYPMDHNIINFLDKMDRNVSVDKDEVILLGTKESSPNNDQNHNNLHSPSHETKTKASYINEPILERHLTLDEASTKGLHIVSIPMANDSKNVNRTKLLSRKTDKTFVASPENEKYGQLVVGDNYIELPCNKIVNTHLQKSTTPPLPTELLKKTINKMVIEESKPITSDQSLNLPNAIDHNTYCKEMNDFMQNQILSVIPIKVSTNSPDDAQDETNKKVEVVGQTKQHAIVLDISPSAKKRARNKAQENTDSITPIKTSKEAVSDLNLIQNLPQSPGIKRIHAKVDPAFSVGRKSEIEDDKKYAIYDTPKNIEHLNESNQSKIESDTQISNGSINKENENFKILQPSVHLRDNTIMISNNNNNTKHITNSEVLDTLGECDPLNPNTGPVQQNKSVRFNPDIVTHLRPASSYSLTEEDIKSKIGFFEAQSQQVHPHEKEDGDMHHLEYLNNLAEPVIGIEDRYKSTDFDNSEYLDALSVEENDQTNLTFMSNGQISQQSDLKDKLDNVITLASSPNRSKRHLHVQTEILEDTTEKKLKNNPKNQNTLQVQSQSSKHININGFKEHFISENNNINDVLNTESNINPTTPKKILVITDI